MYVKQGLKREEAIDFLRERLSSISLEYPNTPRHSEFVIRPKIALFRLKRLQKRNWSAQENYWVKEQSTSKSYIWLGEIKCNMKCLSQALLTLPIVISSVWGVIRVKIQFSCSVVLFCYFVVLLWCFVILFFHFIVLLFGPSVQLCREFGYSRLTGIEEKRSRKKSIASSRLRPCLAYICIAASRRWSSFHDENLLSTIFDCFFERKGRKHNTKSMGCTRNACW